MSISSPQNQRPAAKSPPLTETLLDYKAAYCRKLFSLWVRSCVSDLLTPEEG